MVSKTKLLLAPVFFLFAFNIYSQSTNDLVIKRDFVPVLDSMTGPPADCIEAWSYVSFDSLTNDLKIISAVDEQDQRIEEIVTQITNILNRKKTDRSDETPFTGKGPPAGAPPPNTDLQGGRSLSQEDLKDIWEDFDDAYLAMTKMIEVKEQFKDEIMSMQIKINEKLHKTLMSDHDAQVMIINEFMQFTEKQYKKHRLVFRENMNKVDGFIKRYNYGSGIKSEQMRSELLKMQLFQAENLKFLSNITKEFIHIGAGFYKEG